MSSIDNENPEDLAALREFLVGNLRVFKNLIATDPEHAVERAMDGDPDWSEHERTAWDGLHMLINDRTKWDTLPKQWQTFIAECLAEVGLTPPQPIDGMHRTKGTHQ